MSKMRQLEAVAARPRWTEGDAAEVLAAWRASGESLSAFAHELGVGRQRIERWRARLEDRKAAVEFHAVRVVGQPTARAEGLELVLGEDVRVRLPSGFDGAELKRLLEVLRETATC
jgi:transposase-like protein